MIENPSGRTRRHNSSKRTQREVDELYQKLRDFQAANPASNLNTLFDDFQADRARL